MDDPGPLPFTSHTSRRFTIDVSEEAVEDLAAQLRLDNPSMPLTESWELARQMLEQTKALLENPDNG